MEPFSFLCVTASVVVSVAGSELTAITKNAQWKEKLARLKMHNIT